jgi:hypothetical protein
MSYFPKRKLVVFKRSCKVGNVNFILFDLLPLLLICNCVIYNLKVPDDDPNKGSKHVGLVHCDCIV